MVDMADKFLSSAESNGNVAMYVMASQLYRHSGQYTKALATQSKAEEGWPDIDGPHFEKAHTYYNLVLLDMVKRGLVDIEMKPVSDFTTESMSDGYLGSELEIFYSHTNSIFDKLFQDKRLSAAKISAMNIFVLSANMDKVAGMTQDKKVKFLKSAFEHYGGVPTQLAILNFRPDARAKDLLREATKEINLGMGASKIACPPGTEIINYKAVESLRARINILVAE
jgi:hypothetical protein